jgi:hypothetical protein
MADPAPLASAGSQTVRRGCLLSPPVLIALVAGLLVGVVTTYHLTDRKGVPAVVQGTVSGVAAESDAGEVQAIAFRFDGRDYVGPGEGESIPVVADVPWTDAAGENHQGDRPACLAAGEYGQRVELAVLDVRGEGHWTSQLVVWVHCLS